jgi:hypothetical protein
MWCGVVGKPHFTSLTLRFAVWGFGAFVRRAEVCSGGRGGELDAECFSALGFAASDKVVA